MRFAVRAPKMFYTKFRAVFNFPRDDFHLSVCFFLVVPHLARLPRLRREWLRACSRRVSRGVLYSCFFEDVMPLSRAGRFFFSPSRVLCDLRVSKRWFPCERVETFSREAVNAFARFVRHRTRQPGLHRAGTRRRSCRFHARSES